MPIELVTTQATTHKRGDITYPLPAGQRIKIKNATTDEELFDYRAETTGTIYIWIHIEESAEQ